MIGRRREKAKSTNSLKTYRRLWREFDYGFISKDELVAGLHQIQNGEGVMQNVK